MLFMLNFADAILKMMDNDKLDFEIFNLGSGVKTRVSEVVQWALKYSGYNDARVQYSRDKPTTIGFRALDCQKAKTLLDWQPEHSIEQGVAETVRWWVENKDTWTK